MIIFNGITSINEIYDSGNKYLSNSRLFNWKSATVKRFWNPLICLTIILSSSYNKFLKICIKPNYLTRELK